MQRVAAPSANFCAGSSTKAPPLTAPCQIGRTQARRAGGFAAVGGGLRPPPKPALRAGCPAGLPHPAPVCGGRTVRYPRPWRPRPVPAGCLPPASASRPPPAKPPLPDGPHFLGIPLQGAGIGPQAVPPFGRDPPAQGAGAAAAPPGLRPACPFPTSPLPPGLRPVCLPLPQSPARPQTQAPDSPIGKAGGLHLFAYKRPYGSSVRAAACRAK